MDKPLQIHDFSENSAPSTSSHRSSCANTILIDGSLHFRKNPLSRMQPRYVAVLREANTCQASLTLLIYKSIEIYTAAASHNLLHPTSSENASQENALKERSLLSFSIVSASSWDGRCNFHTYVNAFKLQTVDDKSLYCVASSQESCSTWLQTLDREISTLLRSPKEHFTKMESPSSDDVSIDSSNRSNTTMFEPFQDELALESKKDVWGEDVALVHLGSELMDEHPSTKNSFDFDIHYSPVFAAPTPLLDEMTAELHAEKLDDGSGSTAQLSENLDIETGQDKSIAVTQYTTSKQRKDMGRQRMEDMRRMESSREAYADLAAARLRAMQIDARNSNDWDRLESSSQEGRRERKTISRTRKNDNNDKLLRERELKLQDEVEKQRKRERRLRRLEKKLEKEKAEAARILEKAKLKEKAIAEKISQAAELEQKAIIAQDLDKTDTLETAVAERSIQVSNTQVLGEQQAGVPQMLPFGYAHIMNAMYPTPAVLHPSYTAAYYPPPPEPNVQAVAFGPHLPTSKVHKKQVSLPDLVPF